MHSRLFELVGETGSHVFFPRLKVFSAPSPFIETIDSTNQRDLALSQAGYLNPARVKEMRVEERETKAVKTEVSELGGIDDLLCGGGNPQILCYHYEVVSAL